MGLVSFLSSNGVYKRINLFGRMIFVWKAIINWGIIH